MTDGHGRQRPRIVTFAGSVRTGSFNARLARRAADVLTDAGADARFVDLADHPMPLYDGDLESREGLPPGARSFKAVLRAADGFVIASPEYNGSFTPLLKNALDWASRSESKDEPPLAAYAGKTAALLAASPGDFGGLRGLVHVRAVLSGIGVTVLPRQLAVSRAYEAFDDDGSLKDDRARGTLRSIAEGLVRLTRALAASGTGSGA